jgi:uncharacterized protein (DUF1697 family)
MAKSLALLRGINVGGNTLIKMADLRTALEDDGFEDVSTYINSGNVIFKTKKGYDARRVEKVITKHFTHKVDVVCFTDKQWKAIIDTAPKTWGTDEKSKHNMLALLDPKEMKDVVEGIGELREGMESLDQGKGVLYQSIGLDSVGKGATGSKMASKAAYKQITVRNYNTSVKLAKLLED